VALKGASFGPWRRLAGTVEGLGTSLVIVLLVAAVVYAASRPNARLRMDLTEGAHYTLTDQTRQVLENLQVPVTIITLFRGEAQAIPTGLALEQEKAGQYVENLVQEYVVAAGGTVASYRVNPISDRAQVQELVREHHITRPNLVLISSEARTEQVFLEELVTIDRGLATPNAIQPAELLAFHGEGPLTSALLRVTSEEVPRVGILTGHGEPSASDFQDFGLGLMAESLRGQGMDLVTVDMGGEARIPDDLAVLVLVGPTDALRHSAVESLRAWHEQGGALLLALQPYLEDARLDAWLAEVGVRREFAILSRDDVPYEGVRRSVQRIRRFNADHPISEPIQRDGVSAIFPTSAGLARSAEAPARLRTDVLAYSDAEAWGDLPGLAGSAQHNFEFDDVPEARYPRSVGMALHGDGTGRVVIFGGSGFLSNAYLRGDEGGPGNMDLALNSMNWLVEREDALAVGPRKVYQSKVDLYGEEKAQVFFYVVGLMPLGGALLGLLVWLARRR
jgi:ABC-2 type transport system permease protein